MIAITINVGDQVTQPKLHRLLDRAEADWKK